MDNKEENNNFNNDLENKKIEDNVSDTNNENSDNDVESNIKPEVSIDVTKTPEYEELDDRYKRLLAEFENYKKEAKKKKIVFME